MKRNYMKTDRWRGFTLAKKPAIQCFLQGHFQKAAKSLRKKG